MPKYVTKQRKTLLEYLESHADCVLTAKQIADEIKDKSISISSIYRNLAVFEEEGKVKRVVASDGKEECYRFVEAENCRGKLHISCKICGKTTHLDAEGTKKLAEIVGNGGNFNVDCTDTVIYGVCKDCEKNS